MGSVKRVKKALAAAAGLAAGGLAAGLFDGTAETVAYAVVSLATVFGVYQAKNQRPVFHAGVDTTGGPTRV